MFRKYSFYALLPLTLGTSCAQPKTAAAPPEEATAEPAPVEESDDVSDEEAELLAQIEESAQIADSGGEADAGASDGEAKREVIYRLTPEGLRVEVEGAEFVPKAEMVKVSGGYGVKLTVRANSTNPVILYSPNNGPLAFGGFVQGATKDKFGDKREGGIEVTLEPGAPVTFSRTWPGPGQAALSPGQKLELHVGLWGLGTSSEDRRPVNRFLVIRMTADQKGGTPLIEPPAQ